MRVIEWAWLAAARVQMRCDRWIETARQVTPGQSTVEYALVGALVVIAAAGAMALLGTQVTNVFTRITTTLSGAATSGH